MKIGELKQILSILTGTPVDQIEEQGRRFREEEAQLPSLIRGTNHLLLNDHQKACKHPHWNDLYHACEDCLATRFQLVTQK